MTSFCSLLCTFLSFFIWTSQNVSARVADGHCKLDSPRAQTELVLIASYYALPRLQAFVSSTAPELLDGRDPIPSNLAHATCQERNIVLTSVDAWLSSLDGAMRQSLLSEVEAWVAYYYTIDVLTQMYGLELFVEQVLRHPIMRDVSQEMQNRYSVAEPFGLAEISSADSQAVLSGLITRLATSPPPDGPGVVREIIQAISDSGF